MKSFEYTRGLHDTGNGCYAYLQPDGSLGWSNAGLIVDGDRALLVDTLFDLPLTREMLAAMKPVTDASPIRTLVNTHANGDHCWGNELVTGAEIVSSTACREEMLSELQPDALADMMELEGLGPGADYARERMGNFEFRGITVTPPTRVFDGELSLQVGDTRVELIEVGPAHTRGDTLVWVPDARTVFTGDILFIDGTPIMWVGPVGNWIGACERMLELDVDVVVPGHGPITGKDGIRSVRDYLRYIEKEARARFDAGMPAEDAARDIALADYDSWGDPERIAVNVDTLYLEFAGDTSEPVVLALLGLMAEIHDARKT
jgi:glyoxylase-like metal-dependent hydrolase (beta-lactamase superfamily II)